MTAAVVFLQQPSIEEMGETIFRSRYTGGFCNEQLHRLVHLRHN